MTYLHLARLTIERALVDHFAQPAIPDPDDDDGEGDDGETAPFNWEDFDRRR